MKVLKEIYVSSNLLAGRSGLQTLQDCSSHGLGRGGSWARAACAELQPSSDGPGAFWASFTLNSLKVSTLLVFFPCSIIFRRSVLLHLSPAFCATLWSNAYPVMVSSFPKVTFGTLSGSLITFTTTKTASRRLYGTCY